MSRQLLQDSLEVLKVAVPNLRREHMILAEKYAGTPYEQDPAYQKAEKAYKQASELQTRIQDELQFQDNLLERFAEDIWRDRANGACEGISPGKGGRTWLNGEFQLCELEALCIVIRQMTIAAGAVPDGLADHIELWKESQQC